MAGESMGERSSQRFDSDLELGGERGGFASMLIHLGATFTDGKTLVRVGLSKSRNNKGVQISIAAPSAGISAIDLQNYAPESTNARWFRIAEEEFGADIGELQNLLGRKITSELRDQVLAFVDLIKKSQ